MEKDHGKERERIEHFSHSHSLVLNEEQSKRGRSCTACLEPLLGPSFSCGENCEFHLHKLCAEAPLQISHSPFHCKRSTLTLGLSRWGCDLCKEQRNMFSYYCSSCKASLDIKCALLLHNIDENFRELKYVAHQHPLTFIQNPNDELQRANCYWCQKPLVDSVYVCLDCQFYLHKKCARLPSELNHPCHRKHTLYIEDAFLVCRVCQTEHWRLFYRCLPCEFDIDIECVLSTWPWSIVKDKNHLEHSFTPLLREGSFVCDACGTEGSYLSYICSTCHIMIHKKCISLPRIIRTSRHHHKIVHKYFIQIKELENHDCGICLSEVKVEHGSYTCLKQDCNYVVHVDCALEMYDEIVDQVNDEDEESSENLVTNSSITCVVEKNEHGEAVKIKHFSHEHDLSLGNKLGDDKHCDGCMLSISTSFYYCSQCEFLLHTNCAELPRKKHQWFHKSLTTLESMDFFKCEMCDHLCSGFAYKTDGDTYFCLRCCRISPTLTSEGHKHPLFFDFKFKGTCNACGAWCRKGAYKCKDCGFALDFACITQPQTTRHKCDKHFLKLTFHDDQSDDDPEKYYCDVCEEKRDPNYWFYHCSICDSSVHPKCALGKCPFIKIKIGTNFPYRYRPHRHELMFVKTICDRCSWCGRPCQDVALQCTSSACSIYIIHYDCWW